MKFSGNILIFSIAMVGRKWINLSLDKAMNQWEASKDKTKQRAAHAFAAICY